MQFDVQFTEVSAPWQHTLECVLAAQDVGFGAVWLLDHFSGDMFGSSSALECFTHLGALAAATTSIGLGTLVANVANRHPGLLAAAAASVQHISQGRLILGLGAGTSPASTFATEQRALGIDIPASMASRHERVGATLDLLDELWADERAERWRGFARPVPRPPIIVGLNSAPLATLAGQRADGMNVRWNHPHLAELLATGRDAFAGRPGSWLPTVWMPFDEEVLDAGHPERRRLEALGVDRVVLSWFREPTVAEIERCRGHDLA